MLASSLLLSALATTQAQMPYAQGSVHLDDSLLSTGWRSYLAWCFTGIDTRPALCLVTLCREEVMTLQQLRHPNVLQFLGACMKMPNLCMVTEHMPHSLHAVLYTMQGVELDRKRIVGLAIEMARAFVYLHSRKPAIVHRCAGEGVL